MEPSKRKAEVVDLTADHKLASRPPKRPKIERQCVIDLSPTVVDLVSDAEAAAAPANTRLPHTSFPPSPEVVDSDDDDAPAGRMALADGQCATEGNKLASQVTNELAQHRPAGTLSTLSFFESNLMCFLS